MKCFFFLLLVKTSFFNNTCFAAEVNLLFPVIINQKFGYIGKRGKVVINLAYEDARNFSKGLAAVAINGMYSYINHKGKFVINTVFGTAYPFSNGQAVVTLPPSPNSPLNEFCVIDKYMDWIVKPTANMVIDSYCEGLAQVRLVKEKR